MPVVQIKNRPDLLIGVKVHLTRCLKFYFNEHYSHKRVMCGIMTAISYINNTGGLKFDFCNRIAYNRWDFCINSVYGYEHLTSQVSLIRMVIITPGFLMMSQSCSQNQSHLGTFVKTS